MLGLPQETEIIVPLTKTPWQAGRIGKRERQDWYQGCALAKELLDRLKAEGKLAKIFILSAFQAKGQATERALYREALQELGVGPGDIETIHHGLETIGQVEYLDTFAKAGYVIHLISVETQHDRVRLLTREMGFLHYKACGIARPSDRRTDRILDILFPALDRIHARKIFLKVFLPWLRRRRARGIL